MADQSIAQKTCTKCGEIVLPRRQCRRCSNERCRVWNATHPHRREYRSWTSAKNRCYNSKAPNYHNYGGRGITMSDEWRESFQTFFADMGPRPPKTTLDRIDNNGPYSRWNCRWATHAEQHGNTRAARLLTVGTITRSVTEWAKHTGIDRAVLFARLRHGWSPEKVVNTPLQTRQGRAVQTHLTQLQVQAT